VDDEFYDTHIVNRWTGSWLAGNDTWVLCFTNRIPYDQYYRPGLIARSAHVLSDVYREKGLKNIKFGLIDTYNQELLLETYWGVPYRFIMCKNGTCYVDSPMQDSYNLLYEFIEVGWKQQAT